MINGKILVLSPGRIGFVRDHFFCRTSALRRGSAAVMREYDCRSCGDALDDCRSDLRSYAILFLAMLVHRLLRERVEAPA
jgi:hypothetical protein